MDSHKTLDLFRGADPRLQIGAVVVVFILAWLVWGIARRIVRIGWFAIAFGIGLAVAYGLNLTMLGDPQPLPYLLAEALAFAWVWSMIRSKVSRVVTAIAVVLVLRIGGSMLSDAKKHPDPKDPAVNRRR